MLMWATHVVMRGWVVQVWRTKRRAVRKSERGVRDWAVVVVVDAMVDLIAAKRRFSMAERR